MEEVFLPGGRSLNRELVRTGMAWHHKQYSEDSELAALEREARRDARGLRADGSAAPSQQFRKEKRESARE